MRHQAARRAWKTGTWVAGAAAVLAVCAGQARAWADGCEPRLSLTSPAGGADDFGRAMAAIGDVDGDGWTDYAIGAPGDAEGGERAGAVYVFSGRDGALLRKIVGPARSATGWSLAAAGDVDGDGVGDVLVGAPGYQPPINAANSQPYKILPAVKAMSTQRVDFVCAAGDSNHFRAFAGFDGGIQRALAQRVPMYATPLHSPNENLGLGLARWGSLISNATGGSVGAQQIAPDFFMAQWDVRRALPTSAMLNRFAYWNETASLLGQAVYGLQLEDDHPIDLSGRLNFLITHGRFAQGAGVIAPEVRLNAPPYALQQRWLPISTSAAGDEMVTTSAALPPQPGRRQGMTFRLAQDTQSLHGPAFVTWLRVENADRPAGFSFSTLWATGGQSARDAAYYLFAVPVASLTHFFEQVRALQGPDKKIVIYMNEGGNDRVDHRTSFHGPWVSSTPAGFRDNLTVVRDLIVQVWNANGWPEEELYFMLTGYHVLADDPQVKLEAELRSLRQVCRDLAVEWPRTTCIDMSAFMTEAEAIAGGWYEDDTHAHLATAGYMELGRRIVDALLADVAPAGAAHVYSGADGRVLLTLDPGPHSDLGDELGFCVAAGGDVNGDGVNDFAAGAPSRFNDTVPGRVVFFSGGDGSVINVVRAVDGRDRFGESIAFMGDVNGDGSDDLAIGNPDDYGLFPGVGSVSVWSGSSGARLWRVSGGQGPEEFGAAVSRAGDINGDGRQDVLVGVPGRSRYGPGTGSARVYHGATGAMLGGVDGQAAHDRLGTSVTPLGDVDGDGRADFAVGSPGSDDPAAEGGMVRVCSGAGLGTLAEFRGGASGEARGSVVADGGSTIEGRGEVLARAGSAVLVLDAGGWCCTADFTRDGVADFGDYLEFLNMFEAGAPAADMNRDGIIDFVDYLEFLTRYEVGC